MTDRHPLHARPWRLYLDDIAESGIRWRLVSAMGDQLAAGRTATTNDDPDRARFMLLVALCYAHGMSSRAKDSMYMVAGHYYEWPLTTDEEQELRDYEARLEADTW